MIVLMSENLAGSFPDCLFMNCLYNGVIVNSCVMLT